MDPATAVTTFLGALARTVKFWEKSHKADSLVRFTQSTRVEPITIIDKSALYLSYLPDVLQSLNSVFAGYYLQAAAITCNVGKINVGNFLNHINPVRPVLESRNAAMECLLPSDARSAQDYRFGLPSPQRLGLESLPAGLSHALESEFNDKDFEYSRDINGVWRARPTPEAKARHKFHEDMKAEQDDWQYTKNEDGKVIEAKPSEKAAARAAWQSAHSKRGFGVSTDLGKDMREAANLAVGRTYTVDISDDGHKASIPVVVRLLTVECEPSLLVHILSDGARVHNSSRKERWFGYKLGDLQFWRDLVFCQDLIDEHKKALLADKNGVYSSILARRRNNNLASSVSLAVGGAEGGVDGAIEKWQPSVGTASNIAVLSRETVKQLEAEVGGKFDSYKVRQKVFEQSMLMLVVVIDPDYDHITIYHRGIDEGTNLSVRDVKAANKGSGPDVAEILKAYQLGHAPTF